MRRCCHRLYWHVNASRACLHSKNVLLQEASTAEGEATAAPQLSSAPGGGVVNVDSEHSLLVVRASAGSVQATVGGPHLSATVAVGSFEIEDLLVGARCYEHRYLARSFEASEHSSPGKQLNTCSRL